MYFSASMNYCEFRPTLHSAKLCCCRHNLIKTYNKYDMTMNAIELAFNIDGLPLYKSCSKQFWPILCRIFHINNITEPFPVCIYFGQTKPPLDLFLEEFVNELQLIFENSLEISCNKYVNVKIRSFCCDTPARAYIRNTVRHNSYTGCDKCCIMGEYVNRHMSFPQINQTPRTHEEFKNLSYTRLQKVQHH